MDFNTERKSYKVVVRYRPTREEHNVIDFRHNDVKINYTKYDWFRKNVELIKLHVKLVFRSAFDVIFMTNTLT